MGIKSRPLLYLRAVSMHHTEGIESGLLLPTPNSSPREVTEEQTMKRKEMYGGNTRAMYLEHYAVMGLLPTPRTADIEGGCANDVQMENGNYFRTNKDGTRWGVKLRDVVESGILFNTPRASDHNMHWKTENWKGDDLGSQLNEILGTRSHLNPRFVAEMMGFPPNWTELPFQIGEKNP